MQIQPLKMPRGAKVLTVQTQGGEPQLWATVDRDAPSVNRTFVTYGTGHEMSEDLLDYIGTYQLYDGTLVFHVFEIL